MVGPTILFTFQLHLNCAIIRDWRCTLFRCNSSIKYRQELIIMPEVDESQKEKEFYVDIPAKCEAFFLKGCNSVDWGMKNRLSKIFDPKSGNPLRPERPRISRSPTPPREVVNPKPATPRSARQPRPGHPRGER